MFGGIRKVPTSCPHCGFTQLEPAGLISTYCRGCGDHYKVTRDAAPAPARKPAKSSLIRRLVPRYRRRVVCRDCGAVHGVALELEITQCPGCGTSIDLRDIEIARTSTREIITQGSVHVAKNAFLNSTRIICGNLHVEGRVSGHIECSGTVRLRGRGICRTKIRSKNLIIDRDSHLRFPYTIHVENALIRGVIEADIVCSGTLHIGRHGGLDGDVQARAMTVDKGASFYGAVEVASNRLEPKEAPRQNEEIRVLPDWTHGLAFGAS